MIQHFVFFKFKPGTPQEALTQHMAMFAELEKTIPQITGYQAGRVTESVEQPKRYDTAHCVTFATPEDLAVYLPHPAHQAFIEANKQNWADVLVIDSVADKITLT